MQPSQEQNNKKVYIGNLPFSMTQDDIANLVAEFGETTSGALHEETIETHREIADAIAGHDPLRAQDAMYLHLVYNRKRILLTEKNS